MFLSNRLRVTTALIFVTAAMFMATRGSIAQTGAPAQGPAMPPIMSANDPHNPIHYTPDQQRQLFALKVQFQTQALKIESDSTLTVPQKQAQVTALAKQDFASFQAALSPSQSAAIKVQVAKQNAMLKVRLKNAKLYQSLQLQLTNSLTAGQKQQIKNIGVAANGKANTIKASSTDMDTKQKQLLNLQQSAEDKMSAIFTPSQKDIFRQMQILKASELGEEERAAAAH